MPTQSEVDQLIALFNSGRYVDLETEAKLLVERYPDSGRAWKILGTALGVQGKDALAAMQQAAALLPEDASVLNNLGNAWQDQGQCGDAEICYRRALEIEQDFAAAHNNLGKTLKSLWQFDNAIAHYHRALELDPEYADANYNLGNALHLIGEYDRAIESFQRALELRPDFIDAYNNLGNVLKDVGDHDGAVTSYQRALAMDPNFADAHNNLGVIQREVGDFAAGEASFRRALVLKPGRADTRSNLLYALNCLENYDGTLRLDEARLYGQMVAEQVNSKFSIWQCAAAPERLRVGLVSGDLRKHPVGYAIESMLAELDFDHIDLIAYPTNPQTQDDLAQRIQPYFTDWRSIHGKSDEDAARIIHNDGIHILLDLSGHTAHNRLPVFAWKPAPIQASWLGYFATTGLVEMDYLLTSEVAVPTEHCANFTETVWYLPDIWLCFTPPTKEKTASALPANANGYLTFGCFQRLDKISDAALMAWIRILEAIPNARLYLANKQLGNAKFAEQFRRRLKQQGVDLERVRLEGSAAARADYLARYAEVDVMLDTFPYPGVTTACEALWMGVPTLTYAGDSLLSRQGAGIVTPAGLGDWVATSEAEYIEKAIELTSDLPKLAVLRAGLRKQVSASPVFDAPRFARNFEAALWGMWRKGQVQP